MGIRGGDADWSCCCERAAQIGDGNGCFCGGARAWTRGERVLIVAGARDVQALSEGGSGLEWPGNEGELGAQPALCWTACLLGGQEAGVGVVVMLARERGAAAAAVRCRCQRRRAASRRLLLLGELGGWKRLPSRKLGSTSADGQTASAQNERQVERTRREKRAAPQQSEGRGSEREECERAGKRPFEELPLKMRGSRQARLTLWMGYAWVPSPSFAPSDCCKCRCHLV